MVTIALGVILVAALAALVWYAWSMVRSAGRAGSPACRGCPMAGECDDSTERPNRTNGADHGR